LGIAFAELNIVVGEPLGDIVLVWKGVPFLGEAP